MRKGSQRGFVALISAIIISAILLVAIGAMGATTFYSRFNTLDAELKERSAAAADACADQALYQLAIDATYAGGTFSLNSIDACRIGKVSYSGSTVQFYVQATSSNSAVTNLQVMAKSGDLSVVSWQEIPDY